MRVNSNKKWEFYKGILPPLPERVISGLPNKLKYNPSDSPFHTVRLWEFTNLHVILKNRTWTLISEYLRQANLTNLSQEVQIKKRVLEEIYRQDTYATHISNLYKIAQIMGLDPDTIENSVKAVRFNRNGSLEYISFPFNIDIYSWRLLCHIAGDGSVKYHKTTRALPEVKWNQLPENQTYMVELLKRWNPKVLNSDLTVKYPKVLTYAIMGSMPGLTFKDLRAPKFIQFVYNLPMSHKDWKVQFLAAFLIDDGTISGNVNFTQTDKKKIELTMNICDQLDYEHSPYPPRRKNNGIYEFRLYATGAQKFLKDLQRVALNNPLLGLWHKQSKLESRISSYNRKKVRDAQLVRKVNIAILTILGDHQCRTNNELHNHPMIRSLIAGKSSQWFREKTWRLSRLGLIKEAETTKYRKYWRISSDKDSKTLIQDYLNLYQAKKSKKKEIRTEDGLFCSYSPA